MLIRYKKKMEKIAMGLLSFMPDENKDIKKLQKRIKEYKDNPNWHLFLWKEEEDIIGVIGIQIKDDLNAVIQDLSVDPSHRNQGIGKSMLNAIEKEYGKKYDVCPTEETQAFFGKYEDAEDA